MKLDFVSDWKEYFKEVYDPYSLQPFAVLTVKRLNFKPLAAAKMLQYLKGTHSGLSKCFLICLVYIPDIH